MKRKCAMTDGFLLQTSMRGMIVWWERPLDWLGMVNLAEPREQEVLAGVPESQMILDHK